MTAPGCSSFQARSWAAVMLSAREHPASMSGMSTVRSGERILAVSAMKCTPQKTMTSASVAAAPRGIVRAELPSRGRILAKQGGVLAGTGVAATVFRLVDPALSIEWKLADGAELTPDATVAVLSGRARAILAGERVALNFLQHLSGVATQTAAFVAACAPHGVKVFCTRKTVPGLRA